jgi:flagellar biogenesis protein FliO
MTRLVLIALLILSVAMLAAQTTTPPDTVKHTAPTFGKSVVPPTPPKLPVNLFKYTLSLLLVFVLIYGFFFFLRRVSLPAKFSRGNADLRLLDILPLNQKHHLYIVAAYGQIYLLSVSPERVGLVDRISDPELLQRLLSAQPEPFRDKLASWLGKSTKHE